MQTPEQEKLFLMNAVNDVPSIYHTQRLAKLHNEKRNAHLQILDLFVDYLLIRNIITIISCVQRYRGEKYFPVSCFWDVGWISSSVEPNESQIASCAEKRTPVGKSS